MLDSTAKEYISKTFLDTIQETPFSYAALNADEIDSDITEDQLETDEFTMLTISSIDFRFVMGIHYSINAQTKSFISQTRTDEHPLENKEEYYSQIYEYAYMLCGTIKRKLGSMFSYLGLSTPEKMPGNCTHHVLNGDPKLRLLSKACFDDIQFYYSMMLYTDQEITPDFETFIEESIAEGELELF